MQAGKSTTSARTISTLTQSRRLLPQEVSDVIRSEGSAHPREPQTAH